MLEMGSHAHAAGGDHGASRDVAQRIDVETQIVFEEPSKRFQDAAFEIAVVFLVEDFVQARHAHHDANVFLRIAEKVAGKPEISAVVRDQHRLAERSENVHAIEKVAVIDLAGISQVLESHLHQDHEFLTLHTRLLDKLRLRVVEHVERDVRDRAKAAALDKDHFFVKHLG